MKRLLTIVTLLILVLLALVACTSSTVSQPTSDYASISISPSLGSYLTNTVNESSEVLLKDIQISKGVSDEQYFSIRYPPHAVNVGESIPIVSGTIQNKHKENDEIDMWAVGYDETGEEVAWTLDRAHMVGHIGLHLETEETGKFTLHLNIADNIESIRISANNYAKTPP